MLRQLVLLDLLFALLGAEPRTEEKVILEMGEVFGIKEEGSLLLVLCSIVLYFLLSFDKDSCLCLGETGGSLFVWVKKDYITNMWL